MRSRQRMRELFTDHEPGAPPMMTRSLLTLSLIALLGGCATNAPTTGVAHIIDGGWTL